MVSLIKFLVFNLDEKHYLFVLMDGEFKKNGLVLVEFFCV